MAKRFDVITVGGATEDIFFTADDYVVIDNPRDPVRQKLVAFEYGAKIGVPETATRFGGGAANTAVAFSRLGFKTAAAIAVGGDERAGRILRNLITHRVDIRCCQHVSGESGVSFILKAKGGEHVIFTHRGANDRLAIHRPLQACFKKAGRIFVTSLTGSWNKVLSEVMSAGRPIAWNPGRAQLNAGLKKLKPFLERTDILIVNRDEAIELAGQGLKPVSALLKRLFAAGPRIVAITDGAKGASAYDGNAIVSVKAAKARESDTTGVGDAFGSTLVAALDRGHGLQVAMRCAVKNSASVVSRQGAQSGLRSARELGI